MVDFLRSNPWCSREEYMWGMTVGQVRLAAMDFSHIEYENKDKKKKKSMSAGQWLAKNLTDSGTQK